MSGCISVKNMIDCGPQKKTAALVGSGCLIAVADVAARATRSDVFRGPILAYLHGHPSISTKVPSSRLKDGPFRRGNTQKSGIRILPDFFLRDLILSCKEQGTILARVGFFFFRKSLDQGKKSGHARRVI